MIAGGAHTAVGKPPANAAAVSRAALRGTALLLAGRGLAVALALVTQVVLVRALPPTEYGRIAYALAVVTLLQAVLPLGTDRGLGRALARYEALHDRARLLGVLAATTAVTVVIGAIAVAAVLLLATGPLPRMVGGSATATVLCVLIVLAPLQALDSLLVDSLAVLGTPREVAFRRYLLDPVLRLVATGVVLATGGGPVSVAGAWVAAALAGSAVALLMLVRRLRLLRALGPGRPRAVLPLGELLATGLPVAVGSVVAIAPPELASVVLGRTFGSSEVAAFRAVLPFSTVGLLVLYTFGTLYTPAAARLHAAENFNGLRDLYARTSCWIAVLSFPIFLLTTVFASPLTTVVLGERYAGSVPHLALLGAAAYVNSALGPNGLTLQVLGRIKYALVANTLVLGVVLAVVLTVVPYAGAGGAALVVLISVIVHNIAKQAGLSGKAGIGAVDRRLMAVLARAAVLTLGCWLLSLIVPDRGIGGLLTGGLVAGTAGLLLARASSRQLAVAEAFPELARVPLLGRAVTPLSRW